MIGSGNHPGRMVLIVVLFFVWGLLLPRVDSHNPPRGAVHFFNKGKADRDDGYVFIPENSPAQRCFSFSCMPDSLSFIEWYEAQEEAWVVVFDDAGCKGKYARMFGPDGKKKLSDLGMDDTVASFMLWESGMYPTRGIVDLCFIDSGVLRIEPASVLNHADDIPSVHHNVSITGIDVGIDGDYNRGIVRAAEQ